MNQFDIAVIGGGAAGFFAGIQAAEKGKNSVLILEKTAKLLQKVKVSGGGRCNITHDCRHPAQLIKYYPRGGKKLRKAFDIFSVKDTVNWFQKRGVNLKTEPDGRMFPVSDSSASVIDCLLAEADKNKLDIRLKHAVESIKPLKNGFEISMQGHQIIRASKVIVTTGGHPKASAYQWLLDLGLEVASPVPSLFTFNVPDSDLKALMGLSVPEGLVRVPGSNLVQEGPVLITHWGFSGPAVLKLSAIAAIELNKRNYEFPVQISWCSLNEIDLRNELAEFAAAHPQKQVFSHQLFAIPARLWQHLCKKAGIEKSDTHQGLSKKKLNKLVEFLIRDPYHVKGKTTFKEEFVSCGGIELSEIDIRTFESKQIPGLYFAGEVLNVDGLTGGFNFQHAWTSGFLAGTDAAAKLTQEKS